MQCEQVLYWGTKDLLCLRLENILPQALVVDEGGGDHGGEDADRINGKTTRIYGSIRACTETDANLSGGIHVRYARRYWQLFLSRP